MHSQSLLEKMPFKPQKILLWAKFIIVIILLIGIVFTANYLYNKNNEISPTATQQDLQPQDIYLAFLNEIYDKIKTHYWNKITDTHLANLYKLAAEKATEKPLAVFFADQNGVNAMARTLMADMDQDQKKDFIVNLNNIVLANLEPFGRSGLFSQAQTDDLKNRVSNVDPETDLYQSLDVSQDASQEDIQEGYQTKYQKLSQIISDATIDEEAKQEAQTELALVERAYETLSTQADRQRYNQSGVESSLDSKLITPSIFYIHLKKMSPTSFEEFQLAANSVNDQPASLNTLIFDLRGNIGGSVDLMQWFLGPFIGPNNLAYEFYHQDEYEPFKTVVGWLDSLIRYKKVVILINQDSQSSAEVMAATLKKYNVGVLIGTPTKGWGTIEQIFPLDNQIDENETYSMFLVHSLTLREDNQPIEGRGVEPHILITDDNWPQQLSAYFNYPELTTLINNLWSQS